MCIPQLITNGRSAIWGVNSQLPNSIVFLDNRQLLYIGGNHLVVHNVNKNTQKFLPLAKPLSGTAAFDASVGGDDAEHKSPADEVKADSCKQTFAVDAFCVSDDKKYAALAYSPRSTKAAGGKQAEVPRVVIYDIAAQRIRGTFDVAHKDVKVSSDFSR